MSEWTNGYRAALIDLQRLFASLNLLTDHIEHLFRDLEGDAFVIEHEQGNKLQRKRLRAAREAMPPQELPL